jgi:XisH protein
MPARYFYHDLVKAALIADGWTITYDPLQLKIGKKDFFVDLGAEQLLAADKEGRKIAVEVKSFPGASDVADLEGALGQYILYQDVLEEAEPDRLMYLAVPWKVFEDLFEEPIGKLLLRRQRLRLIVFDPNKGFITQWIPD